MKATLLGVILFFTLGAFGQTFLGKRYFLSIGTAISPTIGFFNTSTDDVDYKTEHTIFPAKIEFEYGIALNQTSAFSLSGFYRGLPNSQYTIERSYGDGLTNYEHSDQYQLSTNMMNISLNLKLYTEYAPIGFYANFAVGFNRTTSTVYPSLHKTILENYSYFGKPSTFQEYRKLESWKENAQFMNIALGIGKSQLITRNRYVDYGFQLGIFMNFYHPGLSKYDPNATPEKLQKSTSIFTKKTAASNALSSNLFQLYVKFGFSK